METLPGFKASVSDKQFLPHPQTYLNNERRNDEIEAVEPGTKEHYKRYKQNVVWKEIYKDLDWDKLYTNPLYYNYLMIECWFEKTKARDIRDLFIQQK